MCNSAFKAGKQKVYDVRELASIMAASIATAPYTSVFKEDGAKDSLNKRDCPAAKREQEKAKNRQIYAPTGKKAVDIGGYINSQSANAVGEIPAHYADTQGTATTKIESTTGMKNKTPDLNALAVTFKDIPTGRRDEALTLLKEFAVKAQYQPESPLPANQREMKAMGIETYPEFKNRTGSTDGKECLKQNWGPWLKTFSEEMTGRKLDRDYMCMDDLRDFDIQLVNRLKHQHAAKERNQFLPSLPMLNKQKANQISEDERHEVYKNYHLANKSLEVA